MIVLGTICFAYASNLRMWLLILFIILFSIGYGGNSALRPSVLRQFFGRTNFGTIFGLLVGINMIGGILGPFLAGWVFDSSGSYQSIWLVFAGLSILALISMLTISSNNTTKPL